MWNASVAAQHYLATSYNRRTVTRCDITSPTGQVLYTFQPDPGSSVAEDETATTRRTATINIVPPTSLSTQKPITQPLVPAEMGDLLHPFTGNEVRPYNGVILPDDTTEWFPMGVFPVSKPEVSEGNGTTAGVTIALSLSDRSAIIARNKWTGAWTGGAGLTVDAAIMAGLKLKWPGTKNGYPLTFNFAPSDVVIAKDTILGIQYTSSGTQATAWSTSQNNPMADFQAWATEAGMELFFDRVGVVVLRPVPTAGSGPIVAVFEEGEANRAKTYQRVLDETVFVNYTTVIGTGARFPSVQRVGNEVDVQTTAAAAASITGHVTVPTLATQATITCGGGAGQAQSGAGYGRGGLITAVVPCTPGTVWQYQAGGFGAGGTLGTGFDGAPSYVANEANTAFIVFGGGGQPVTGGDGILQAETGATITSRGTNSSNDGYLKIQFQASVLIPGPVVRGTAYDNNANSVGYINGPLGTIPADAVVSPNISTETQAAAAAAALLVKGEALADETSVTAIPNPLIDAGDACSMLRTPMRIANSYVMSAITTPLGVGADQTITNRAASIEVLTGKAFEAVALITNPTPAYTYGKGHVVVPIPATTADPTPTKVTAPPAGTSYIPTRYLIGDGPA